MARPLLVMIGSSVGSWLALTASGAAALNPELVLGMAGPLASACVTWLVIVRAHGTAPERVTSVMIAGFFVKLLFFGAYVGLLPLLGLRAAPFALSFAAYFILLHVLEAWYLKQLFDGTPRRGAATLDAVES